MVPQEVAALAELGLPTDADAGAVRQAYARQLKGIDQIAQPQAFQTLRETYEAALAAIRRRDDKGPRDTVPLAQPRPVSPIDSAALAQAAFTALGGSLRTGFSNATAAKRDLSAALLPLDLAGGALFEREVASLLVHGWRPGHDLLFDAACEVFGWQDHPDTLHKLEHNGEVLGAAIREKLAFHGRPADVLARQQKLVRRLRNPNPPTRTFLRDERPLLRVLIRRYPHWMGIITSMENATKWLGGPNALQAAYEAPEQSLYEQADEHPLIAALRIVAFFLWLIYMAWDFFG